MKQLLRILVIIILPLTTLILGWQLGARFEEKQLTDQFHELEFLYSGNVGSGELITDPEQEVDPALLWAVWRLFLKNYISPEDLQVQPMLYGAARGMVESIEDPYSVFMTPSENKDFRQSLNGELQGIGAELTLRDGAVTIVAPLKGSPTAKAGLLPHDIIVEVDRQPIEKETLHETVQRIRGPQGTDVTLTIIREGESKPLTFKIERAEIKIPSVEYELKKTETGSIGYISINQFAEDTNEEVEEALLLLKEEDLDGIILDVRYNGGGYLDKAVDLVSMFMQQGKVVSVQRRIGEPDAHYVYGRPIDTETPMVVLINEGSASASEILAGALQDHNRATVIGKQSFGKGTIQEIFELPGGASVRITVAKWLTPNGLNLGEEGVTPDIEIERTPEDFEAELDPQLDAAMEALFSAKQIIREIE